MAGWVRTGQQGDMHAGRQAGRAQWRGWVRDFGPRWERDIRADMGIWPVSGGTIGPDALRDWACKERNINHHREMSAYVARKQPDS
jgi:hypothetical protein